MTGGVLAIVLFAGLAVGMTGIGGLLLVPALTVIDGMPLTRAVPASTLAFLFTGLAATAQVQWQRRAQYAARAGATEDEPAVPQLLGLQITALLGAGIGALSLSWLPVTAVHLALACLALTSGAQTLLTAAPPEDSAPPMKLLTQCAIGLAIGLGSAWSGTGGPILILPVLMWLRTPTRVAIAMAMAIQLPIALSATGVNLLAGHLDWRLGFALGALLLVGWAVGIWIAARMHTRRLRQALGGLLVGVGLWYALHILQA